MSDSDSDDITLLVRKIAKCERLLKKPVSTSTSKLQKKRTEYIIQLGELAYQAALASPMMLAAGPSPTTVTEKLDPSNFAQFHDSLAIFEHPSILNGNDETDNTQPDEYKTDLPVVEDKVEEQEQDEEEPQVKTSPTIHASSDLPSSIEETTTTMVPTSSEFDDAGIPSCGPLDEQDNKSCIPQSITDNDEAVIVETEVDALLTTEDAQPGTSETDFADDESLDLLQSTTEADTVQEAIMVEKATGTEPPEPANTADTNEPQVAEPLDGVGQENSKLIDTATANLGDPISIHSVETNASEPPSVGPMSNPSPSASSSKGSEFDGEASVSKLRAMFDSPTGEKPRRSWRPKRVLEAIPPAPLATSEDAAPTEPVPTTVTMQVQQGSDQGHAVITLRQAVMTSSVHDIDSPLVALVSLFPESLHAYLQKQNRALLIFNALGIEPLYVDGSSPDERERRDELFRLSGKRGEYPQLFVRKEGKLEFFADFDKIELLNDCDTLKAELEAACQ